MKKNAKNKNKPPEIVTAHSPERMRALGVFLRQGRVRARLRQKDLALKVGLSRTSLTNIERGRQRTPFDTVDALMRHLGLNYSQLESALSIEGGV